MCTEGFVPVKRVSKFVADGASLVVTAPNANVPARGKAPIASLRVARRKNVVPPAVFPLIPRAGDAPPEAGFSTVEPRRSRGAGFCRDGTDVGVVSAGLELTLLNDEPRRKRGTWCSTFIG